MPALTTHDSYPPFPPDLPTASLGSISLKALQSPSDHSESAKVFNACRSLGFFYLDLLGSEVGESILRAGEELLAVSQEFFCLPHETKDQYGQDKVDPFFAYRWTQCAEGVRDAWDRPGRREMYNLRVDDLLDIRPHLPRHAMISSAELTLSTFALRCREVVGVLLKTVEQCLLLPPNTLLDLHRDDAARGDFISLQHRAYEPYDEPTVRKGEHTDFGSITMLFNWLGGLQIREQSDTINPAGRWVYVKPIPGTCIINLGDSLLKLSAGLLRSSIHRVVPPPGPQANIPRYSLVYFSHPNDNVELEPVKGSMIPSSTSPGSTADEKPITAAEWVIRRSLGDLRGVFTTKGLEWRDNNDAVAA